jgi:hypothetical protein
MLQFITGAIAMAYWVAGLFFLRYWRLTRDRLFALFAASFWLFGLVRVAQAALGTSSDRTMLLYWVRLIAYALILAAIADKNWPRARREG